MRDFLSAWEGFRGEADEYRELDEERVLVFVQMRGRGKTSGVELEQLGAKAATLYRIRNGKVIEVVAYLDSERALADLGLASEGR
jgi:ketosteroid isomerase-like protein